MVWGEGECGLCGWEECGAGGFGAEFEGGCGEGVSGCEVGGFIFILVGWGKEDRTGLFTRGGVWGENVRLTGYRVNAVAPGPVDTEQFRKECQENPEQLWLDAQATYVLLLQYYCSLRPLASKIV